MNTSTSALLVVVVVRLDMLYVCIHVTQVHYYIVTNVVVIVIVAVVANIDLIATVHVAARNTFLVDALPPLYCTVKCHE